MQPGMQRRSDNEEDDIDDTGIVELIYGIHNVDEGCRSDPYMSPSGIKKAKHVSCLYESQLSPEPPSQQKPRHLSEQLKNKTPALKFLVLVPAIKFSSHTRQ